MPPECGKWYTVYKKTTLRHRVLFVQETWFPNIKCASCNCFFPSALSHSDSLYAVRSLFIVGVVPTAGSTVWKLANKILSLHSSLMVSTRGGDFTVSFGGSADRPQCQNTQRGSSFRRNVTVTERSTNKLFYQFLCSVYYYFCSSYVLETLISVLMFVYELACLLLRWVWRWLIKYSPFLLHNAVMLWHTTLCLSERQSSSLLTTLRATVLFLLQPGKNTCVYLTLIMTDYF